MTVEDHHQIVSLHCKEIRKGKEIERKGARIVGEGEEEFLIYLAGLAFPLPTELIT